MLDIWSIAAVNYLYVAVSVLHDDASGLFVEAVITAANVAVKAVNIHIQGVMMPREGSKLNG